MSRVLKNHSLLLREFIYSAVTIPAGRATMAIPKNDDIIATARPAIDTG